MIPWLRIQDAEKHQPQLFWLKLEQEVGIGIQIVKSARVYVPTCSDTRARG